MPRHGAASLKITRAVIEAFGDRCHLRGPGCMGRATARDHLIPYSLGGPDELGNLRPACKTCNSRRGNRVINGYGASVTVVIGPPASGKTTHVRLHAKRDDVVVDLDRIAEALTPEAVDGPTHTYPPHLRHVAIGARKAAIDRATRMLTPGRVWIIHADPTQRDLELYRMLRYDLVTIDPGRDVVEARVRAERPTELGRYVARWYARHAPEHADQPVPIVAVLPASPVAHDPDADW